MVEPWDTVFELPVPNGNPAWPVWAPRVPAQGQVSAARWIASRKLPNWRRIVFSDGRMAASVQLSAVGIEPCSATNLRRAATASAIRVSAISGSGTASPSNTPGGFVLWELRSTHVYSNRWPAGRSELLPVRRRTLAWTSDSLMRGPAKPGSGFVRCVVGSANSAGSNSDASAPMPIDGHPNTGGRPSRADLPAAHDQTRARA